MDEGKGIKIIVSVVITAVLLVISGFWFFEKIDNGNVGIEYSMSGGVKNKALSQGVHWVGLDKVTQYPIKTQTIKQKIALASSDGKKTDVEVNYSYHVDPTKATDVYKKFGNVDVESIEKGWLNQQLTAAGRKSMSKYTLLEVVGTDSTKVQSDLLKEFQNRAASQGFIVEDLSFGTPSLDHQTKKSIDDIIKAGQDNKKAELEAKTRQTKAEAAAKAKLTKADAEAKANEKISKSITQKVIDNKTADARLKHGWVTTQAGSAIVDK
ncbi:SPFH domain-containing protein [Pediococcus pentosaceus]|uniref:SPFH domain-containing protein n=1 Tax=Pediococcus pentosaceus TaxID=1255 RepID=UPI0020181105|nr:SPFH domain-containing protein [Pediococcus pentosaceus]MCL3857916.1 SPFH domain-containing protein [Pediococcus pentosaceus]